MKSYLKVLALTSILILGGGASRPGLVGKWTVVRSESRSPVTLDFGESELLATIGCFTFASEYAVSGNSIVFKGVGAEKDGGCERDERLSQRSTDYARKLLKTVETAKTFSITGHTLTLTSADGSQVVFRRLNLPRTPE